MKVLLIYVPSKVELIEIPYGILYVASSLLQEGHQVEILDLAVDTLSDDELLSKIEAYRPGWIGFGALASGYKNLKRLSLKIKKAFPEVVQIAGGIIASASRLLISNTAIDIVVLKEGEIVVKNIVKAISGDLRWSQVRGIAFRGEDGAYQENPLETQISDLDTLPIPPYHLIDVRRHCVPVDTYMDGINWEGVLSRTQIDKIKARGKYRISIISARGCVGHCSFCYRHLEGFRQYSPRYVVNLMQFIQREYDIHFFRFIDELTNVSRVWCLEFCDLLESEKMDITYMIDSFRVNQVDESLLERLKQTGCIRIAFGFESGSQKILDYIGKGTTMEENYRAGHLMRKVGIYGDALIVAGFPPDSPATIAETIAFLQATLPHHLFFAYLTPYPGTRDWEYCLKKKLIKSEEEFMLGYDDKAGNLEFKINLTSYPDRMVRDWQWHIYRSLYLAELKAQGRYAAYLLHSVYYALGFPALKKMIFRNRPGK